MAATLSIGPPRRALVRLGWLVVLGVHAYGLYRASSGTGYLTALCLVAASISILAWPALRSARRHVTLAWVASIASVLAVGGLVMRQMTRFEI